MRAGDESFERLRDAIDELATADVDELLAEARAEARARVRTMLTDALAHSMLERVHERLDVGDSEQPSPADCQPPAAANRSGERIWYVYGVIGSDQEAPANLAGVDPAHAVTTLSEGAVAAVASQVALEDFGESELRAHLADMDWVELVARVHERTLEEVRAHATVIPMRMCTVYRTEGGVRDMLRREAEALTEALAHLHGKTEWGVKAFAEHSPTTAAEEETDGAGSQSTGTGTAYMERRLRERDAVQRAMRQVEEAVAQIHERLCAAATDGLLSPPQRPEVSGRAGEMVLNGVYLVDDEEQEAFHDEVTALQDEFGALGLHLEPTGPWPPYNFVPGTIGAAW